MVRRSSIIPALIAFGAFVLASYSGFPRAAVHADDSSQEWREALIQSLAPGDIVFRRGIGATADAVAAASTLSVGAAVWTHVGIVTRGDPSGPLAVVHASDDRGVVQDPPERFFSRAEASAGSKISVKDGEGASKAALAWLGTPFGFRVGEIYCTQLVLDAFESSGTILDVKARRLPMIAPVVLPDDLAAALAQDRL